MKHKCYTSESSVTVVHKCFTPLFKNIFNHCGILFCNLIEETQNRHGAVHKVFLALVYVVITICDVLYV